jgi:hypothetical protein
MGIVRKLGVAVGAAILLLMAGALPAGAEPAGTVMSPKSPSIFCRPIRGHYCAKVIFTSVAGGIRVNATRSTGYTFGSGQGREWFRYSCNAGTCYVLPSAIFVYHGVVQLNVNRSFGGGGLFLPCGAVLGVDYINPAVNAPGPGALLFHVTCSGVRSGIAAA